MSAARATARRSRTRLEVVARRSQLLALGIDVFSREPYDEMSIDRIAQAAGISKGLLYHYFPTKRDFYVACLDEAARQLVERTRVDEGSPEQRARRSLDAYLDYVAAHGPAYVALLRGGIGFDPEVAAIVERTRTHFVERLLEGIGVAEPDPLLRAALRGFIGFVEAASLDWVAHRDLERDAVRDLLLALLPPLLQTAGQPLPVAGSPR